MKFFFFFREIFFSLHVNELMRMNTGADDYLQVGKDVELFGAFLSLHSFERMNGQTERQTDREIRSQTQTERRERERVRVEPRRRDQQMQ